MGSRRRSELKNYFIKGRIPKEEDFQDFIDSTLYEKARGDTVMKGKLKRCLISHLSCTVQRALAESLIARSTHVNGAITSSMLGDWSLSDAFIDRFECKNIM